MSTSPRCCNCHKMLIPRIAAPLARCLSVYTMSSCKMLPAIDSTTLTSGNLVIPRRSVVRCSKNKGKMKSVKAVVKRFKRTGHGKLKRWRANCQHNSLRKNKKQRKKNKKGVFVSHPQLKLLNMMLSNR